jgi:hypothetical protein
LISADDWRLGGRRAVVSVASVTGFEVKRSRADVDLKVLPLNGAMRGVGLADDR